MVVSHWRVTSKIIKNENNSVIIDSWGGFSFFFSYGNYFNVAGLSPFFFESEHGLQGSECWQSTFYQPWTSEHPFDINPVWPALVETLSLGKARLYEDKTNVSLSVQLCSLEMYNDDVCKPAIQEHCALSVGQNRLWTDFHVAGAALGLLPSRRQHAGLQGGWSPRRRRAELGWRRTLQATTSWLSSTSALVGSKAVENPLNMI